MYGGGGGGQQAATPTGSGIGTLSGSGYGGSAGGSVPRTWNGTSWSFEQLAPGQSIPQSAILFYQPVPGVFEPADGGPNSTQVPSGTPLYVLPNSGQPTGLQQGNTNPGTKVVPQ